MLQGSDWNQMKTEVIYFLLPTARYGSRPEGWRCYHYPVSYPPDPNLGQPWVPWENVFVGAKLPVGDCPIEG